MAVTSHRSDPDDTNVTEDQGDVSDRTRGTAIPLAVLLGVFGGHRFYVGKTGSGVLMACTLGGMGLWWLYDLILLATGEFRDADGHRLIRWSSSDPGGASPRALGPVSEAIRDELDAMRTEMSELAERVDFMERILTKVRERDAIPPGSR